MNHIIWLNITYINNLKKCICYETEKVSAKNWQMILEVIDAIAKCLNSKLRLITSL